MTEFGPDFFQSPEMRQKFGSLDPELLFRTMYVYVNSCREADITLVQPFNPADLEQVLADGQEVLGFSDADKDTLQGYLANLLSDDHYRAHIFNAFAPKSESN